MGSGPKNRRKYICFVVVCVLITVSLIALTGYRIWMFFTTDWSEVLRLMRLIDGLITLMIMVMIFAISKWAKSKP